MLLPNTQRAAGTVLQGWSLGRERVGAFHTRQVDCSLPIPAVPSEWQALYQPLSMTGYELPVKPGLVKGCKYSIDSFSDPSYHVQWQVSNGVTLFL